LIQLNVWSITEQLWRIALGGLGAAPWGGDELKRLGALKEVILRSLQTGSRAQTKG
jgi:hypothetical protein